jgi:hypothetical protein
MEIELMAALGAKDALAEIYRQDVSECAWCSSCFRLHPCCVGKPACNMTSLLLPVPSQQAMAVLALSGLVAEIEV